MKKTKVIYVPSGRAKEYSDLALNLSTKCFHRCKYCYVPSVLHTDRESFTRECVPRKGILGDLEKDAVKIAGDDREILLCFTCDPYQPDEMKWGVTREAIEILMAHDLRFTLLTKGGLRACRDFDLLKGYDKCSLGMTIIFADDLQWKDEWEPNAPRSEDRMAALRFAHELGIRTWISIEPVVAPYEAQRVIEVIHEYTDFYKIGKFNYHPGDPPEFKRRIESIDWSGFMAGCEGRLELERFTRRDKIVSSKDDVKGYYLKKDLLKAAGAE